MISEISPKGYTTLLKEITHRISNAQYAALKTVNQALVGLYWDIGQLIIERQQVEGWGKAIVEQLAKDLQKAFPKTKGFSSANLWRMRLFYETYGHNSKLAPVVREIGWTHNLIILERCKDILQAYWSCTISCFHKATQRIKGPITHS